MPTVRLVYYSRARQDLTLLDIQRILQTARRHNAAVGVCGMLSYESQWFLQALEGEREQVNELYLRIAEDPRHYEVTIVAYEEIGAPTFADWGMGYAGESSGMQGALQALGLPAFDPPAMTPAQAFALLRRLAAQQAVAA